MLNVCNRLQNLKRKEKEAEHEVERLAKEKISLQNKIANLKRELPSHLDVDLITTSIPVSVRESSDLPMSGDFQDNSSMGKLLFNGIFFMILQPSFSESFPPHSHQSMDRMSTETPTSHLVSFVNGAVVPMTNTRSPTNTDNGMLSSPRTTTMILPSTLGVNTLMSANKMQFVSDSSMPMQTSLSSVNSSPISNPMNGGGKHKDAHQQLLPSTTTILAVPNFGSNQYSDLQSALKMPIGLNLSSSAMSTAGTIPMTAINLSTTTATSIQPLVHQTLGKVENHGKNGIVTNSISGTPVSTTTLLPSQMFLPQSMQKQSAIGTTRNGLIVRDFPHSNDKGNFVKGNFSDAISTTIIEQPSTKVIKLMNGNMALAPATSQSNPTTTTVQIFDASQQQQSAQNQQQCLLPIFSSNQNGSFRVIGHQTTTPEQAAKFHQQLSSGMVISSTAAPSMSHQFITANGMTGNAYEGSLRKLLINEMILSPSSPMMAQNIGKSIAMPSGEMTALPGGAHLNFLANGAATSGSSIVVTNGGPTKYGKGKGVA